MSEPSAKAPPSIDIVRQSVVIIGKLLREIGHELILGQNEADTRE